MAAGEIGMRVLLVEDDSVTAQAIDLMLKGEGFNVFTTDLGQEGIALGTLYDYDIVLLDVNLPDTSGFEVLRSLRASKVKTPVLILSGLAGIEDKVKGLGFAADDYMTKPFTWKNWWHASMPLYAAPRGMPSRSSRPVTYTSTSIQRLCTSTARACP
jgi:CheY-like chemotaxis protein